jgi:nuclear pore complex protein Nup155
MYKNHFSIVITPVLFYMPSSPLTLLFLSFLCLQWPTQVRMLSPIVNEMPGMVTDRYNACQTVAFCGIFPEIRRAWASVDNSLYLWRFDKWQDIPIEYSGEEQAIVSVGLCTPRPGVFVEAIRHIMIVCTTTEIVLLGVCCSAGAGGTGDDDCEEVTLQPLPLYSVPSDDVAMTSVACTANGRIFLGGADGNLYEIKYSAAESWRTKRCSKICHTGGLRQYLPSFLPGFLFGASQALVDLVIDPHRNILYTRTQASALQVYDLGTTCDEAPHRVAEAHDFLAESSRAMGGREVFGRGAGDKKGAVVVHMAVIPPAESRRLHLLTVTADGRRVYWAAASSRISSKPAGPRPDRLRAEIARQAMPSPSAAARAAGGGGAHHTPARGLEVVAAGYGSGTLLFAESSPGEARTRLFLLSRDLTIPPVGTATGAHVAVAGLRESIAELDIVLPGEACAIKGVPSLRRNLAPLLIGTAAAEASIRDELTTQNVAPPPRFAVVTTAGVAEVERLRPADVLAQLLQGPGGPKLELFFKSYAPREAAAMCIQLAASGPPVASSTVVAHAKAALDNPLLCGEPQLRDGGDGTGDNAAADVAPEEPAAHFSGGFDMGAVVPVAEPEWSGAHKGLCLYVARLLQPAWDEQIVSPIKSSPALLKCALPVEGLQALEDKLRALDAFLVDFLARRKARRRQGGGHHDFASSLGQPASKRQRRLEDAVRLEIKRTESVKALVSRAADACFLLRALVEHNLSRLSARLEGSARASLRPLRFRDWVAGDDGEAVAAQLIAVLVSEHLSAAGGLAEDLAAALQQGCPSYFRESDRVYYNASGLLRRAENASTSVDRDSFTKDAVSLLARVPLACDLAQIVPQLALLRSLDAVVELSVRKAASIDPNNAAYVPGPHGEAARVKRDESCYSHVASVLRVLSEPITSTPPPSLEAFQKSLSTAEKGALKEELLRRVAATSDGLLHEAVYSTLVDTGSTRDLLSLDVLSSSVSGGYLEPYLVRASGLSGAASGAGVTTGPLSPSQVAHADVLARLYIGRTNYSAAAGVYELLASRAAGLTEVPDPTLDGRIAHLQAAVLQARSCGDTTLVDRLEVKVKVAQIQAQLIESLTTLFGKYNGAPDSSNSWDSLALELKRDDCEAAVSEMKRSLYSLEDLYNDIARPSHQWSSCVELLDTSVVSDVPYMRQLWDLLLKSEWQKGWDEAAASTHDVEQRAHAALRATAEAVSHLGERFYPNESSFPASSVLMRLEQAAAGTWPVIPRHEVELESTPVQRAMLAACGNSYESVVRVYESLLSSRGNDPHAEELQVHSFKLRILRSLRDVIAAGKQKAAERAPAAASGYAGVRAARRELGVLAAACEAFGSESRRLSDGEELANEFAVLGESLQSLMGYDGGANSLYG